MTPFEKLRIPYETSEFGRFQYVGRFAEGNQFMAFVTGAIPGPEHYPPLESGAYEEKRWLAVVHIFDADGKHLRSESRLGGLDRDGHEAACERAWAELGQMFTELGLTEAEPGCIYVRAFSVELDGVNHELVYESVEEDDGVAYDYVMLWPHDIMFHPPWDSGEYST